ncbi:MAG: YhdT family protein [Kurthia sp.]
MKDKRYRIANREALMGVALVIVNFAIWYGFAYGLGSGDPDNYTYVFGFPAWFVYSCIAGTGFLIVLIFIVIKFFFKEVDFEEDEK